jgi:ABC-type Fe3+/spermidine/putrescine transport system ATPase subunit
VTAARLSLQELTKRFDSRTAVDRLTLEIAEGEAIVILGPSGCGKTTLLRLIAGLEVPDEGRILLSGVPAAAAGRNLIPPHRRYIGFVFQDLALWPHLTIRGHLEFVLGSVGVPRLDREPRARETLELVHMDAHADRYPHQLSGGEQQRAALARALVGRPTLLLLDEPFSSLDPALREELRVQLATVHRRLGLTTIYVSHDPADAAALADATVEMKAGRLMSLTRTHHRETGA